MRTITRRLLAGFLLCLFASLLPGCAENEPDQWVTVRIDPADPNGGPPDASDGNERLVLPDLASRGVEYKDLICGVIENKFSPGDVRPGPPPSRVYHFLVRKNQARMLISTGKYIPRESYGPRFPFSAIPCFLFSIVPRPT